MALVGFVSAAVDATEKGPQLPEPISVTTEILPANEKSNSRPIIRVVADFPAPEDNEAEENAKGTRITYCRAKAVDLPLKDSEQRRMQCNIGVYVQVPRVDNAATTTTETDTENEDDV